MGLFDFMKKKKPPRPPLLSGPLLWPPTPKVKF